MLTFNFIVFVIVGLLAYIFTVDRICSCIEKCSEKKHSKPSLVDMLGLASNNGGGE